MSTKPARPPGRRSRPSQTAPQPRPGLLRAAAQAPRIAYDDRQQMILRAPQLGRVGLHDLSEPRPMLEEDGQQLLGGRAILRRLH
jgi:hypothetical protein